LRRIAFHFVAISHQEVAAEQTREIRKAKIARRIPNGLDSLFAGFR